MGVAENDDDDDDEGGDPAFSRAASAASRSSTKSSVKRDVVSIQNWYPIRPIVAAIPAHKSTIWSCAFQTVFTSIAELHVPLKIDLGHNEFRIDHVEHNAYFLNFSALTTMGPDRFPVCKKGVIKETRVLTDTERNDQRVKKKEEMMRRARTPPSDGITHASSTASDSKKIVIDDFVDQENLSGKIVIINIPKNEPAQLRRAPSLQRMPSFRRAPSFERAPSVQRAPSFERASSASGISLDNIKQIIQNLIQLGVQAIIIAMDEVERYTEIQGELPEIVCPVL